MGSSWRKTAFHQIVRGTKDPGYWVKINTNSMLKEKANFEISNIPRISFVANKYMQWFNWIDFGVCCKYSFVWKTSCVITHCVFLWQVFLFHAIVRLSETNIAPPPWLLVPSHPEMHKFRRSWIWVLKLFAKRSLLLVSPSPIVINSMIIVF